MSALTEKLKSSTAVPSAESDPLKADFRNFLYLLWNYLGLPDPTPLQYDIAHQLQHGPKRDIIEAFRGAAKSWITAAYVLWRLYCNPLLIILVVSATAKRAENFTRFTREIIGGWDLLAFLRPTLGQRDSILGFDVGPTAGRPDQNPSVSAKGVTGQLAGSRADIIVADDVEIPRNADTEVKRAKLREQVKEFDAILKPGGEVKYLGTPQTERSIYPTLQERGYHTTIWPVLYPTVEKLDTEWGRQLALSVADQVKATPSLAGTSTEPSRFNADDLAARRLSYGSLGFALQFMLDVRAATSDKFPLKLRDLIVLDCADPKVGPEALAWAGAKDFISDLTHYGMEGDRLHNAAFVSKDYVPWQKTVMAIDPSGKGKDETSFAILRFLNGRLFLTDFGGIAGGFEEPVLKKLGEIAIKANVETIIIEDNFGLGMFGALLSPFVGGREIVLERSTIQKERRIIQTLEPLISGHRFVVDRSALERDYQVFSLDASSEREDETGEDSKRFYALTYQLSRLTFEKKCLPQDDRIDVVAMAAKFFVDRMDASTGLLMKRSQERRVEEDLLMFMDGIYSADTHCVVPSGHAPKVSR